MNYATHAALLVGILMTCGHRAFTVIAWAPDRQTLLPCPHLPQGAAVSAIMVGDDAIEWFDSDRRKTEIRLPSVAGQSVQFRVSRWDKDAMVYVTAGLDERPGVAKVDDDGNGVTDDLPELGATGTDDEVISGEDAPYEQARTGATPALVISRGAMRAVDHGTLIDSPTQVRIDCIINHQLISSQILDVGTPQTF